MSPSMRAMLRAADGQAIMAPAEGAYRRRGGEVDHISCFPRRSIRAAVERGWLRDRGDGGYLTTDAGRAAMSLLKSGIPRISTDRKATLNEIGLPLPGSFDTLMRQAEESGYELIGEGGFSNVLAHPDEPETVLRISNQPDNFLVYAAMVYTSMSASPQRHMMPIIHDGKVMMDGTTIFIVDRLYPLRGYPDDLGAIMQAFPDQAEDLKALLRGLYDGIETFGPNPHAVDLDPGNAGHNIMQKADGTLVVSDPLGDTIDYAGVRFIKTAWELRDVWQGFHDIGQSLEDWISARGAPSIST